MSLGPKDPIFASNRICFPGGFSSRATKDVLSAKEKMNPGKVLTSPEAQERIAANKRSAYKRVESKSKEYRDKVEQEKESEKRQKKSWDVQRSGFTVWWKTPMMPYLFCKMGK